MFGSPDCKGYFGRAYSPKEVGLSADYNQDEMLYANIWPNDMDSILVPFGTSVTVWAGAGFDGPSY